MANQSRTALFVARTTDGNSASIALFPGFRDYTLLVTGTFDGATVTIQGSHDNTTFAALGSSTTVTTVGQVNFQTAVPFIRANISNDGASTNLNVWVGS